MKISNKEKIMLCVLGSVIVGFLYYQFVYLSQINQLQEKLKSESEIKQKYDNAMNTINSIEDKKSDVKILKAKVNDQTVPFYPIISEEKIILELDKLLKDSDLEGSIVFQPISSDTVENSKKEVKSLAESSLQGIVDQYNYTVKDNEETQKGNDKTNNNSTKNDTNNNSNNSNSTDTANNSKESTKDAKKNTVQYLKCEVKFAGKYEGIYKFLSTISLNEKKIVVNDIKLSSDTIDGIKGTIKLEFYSVPKINDELASYLKWDFDKSYGKSVPFGAGTVTTSSDTSVVSGQEDKKEESDFIASVKSVASDLPTIMMGKTNDDLRTTYVYADSNSEEKVEMILTQDGDKYYYKYKTLKGTFPTNYDGLGAEFIPAAQNIVLNILSRSRLDANDNSAIRLKIVNKTDKLLNVNISGDDYNNPRVKVEGDLSNISVNNK